MFTIFDTSQGNHILVEKTNKRMVYCGEFDSQEAAIKEAEELGSSASEEYDFTRSEGWRNGI